MAKMLDHDHRRMNGLSNLRNLRRLGRIIGKASRHNVHEILYGAESFSSFSVEQERNDLVVRRGRS